MLVYTSLLKSFFRHEDIFRISGDEFMIILVDMDEAVFRKRIVDFRDTLIKTSEGEMYVEKTAFHREHPQLSSR